MNEKPDYDVSIHSNPSAKAWAEFFNETLVKNGKQPMDLELMIVWFANAMMAMHDHIKQTEATTKALLAHEEGIKSTLNAKDGD